MAITASNWSTKYHVHLRRVTDTCQAYTDPKLKQTLAMSCYEEYLIPVRAIVTASTGHPITTVTLPQDLHLPASLLDLLARLHIPYPELGFRNPRRCLHATNRS